MKAKNAPQDLLERGLRLQEAGRTKEAESLFRQLISRNAEHHRALGALGILLSKAGRVEEACGYFERAVSVQPHPQYLTNLGATYRRIGRLDLAAESFGRILEIDADFPDARVNLAATLADAGIFPDAVSLVEEAIQRGGDGPRARTLLSWLLLRLHRPLPALAHARRAVELAPALGSAHRQLADALDVTGDKAAAIASYRRAVELSPGDDAGHSDLIMAMLSSPDFDERAIGMEARAWARRHADPLREHIRPLDNDLDPERRLRIGYVSPDFRAHALEQFLVPLFEHHDPSAYEVFLYSSVERPDPRTEWYRAFGGKRFREIRYLDDVAAAELVRRDEIDILVDLALHSTGGRLRVFACRPAPVQVTWLGYPGTTGLDTIDYRFTDPFVDPPGFDLSVYSETSVHLPETFWCYAPLATEPAVTPLPALSAKFVTFGCQNNYRKLHDDVFRVWARVLRKVPSSRLLLTAEEHAHDRVRRAFQREGVQGDRLEFGPRTSRPEYLRRYQQIDLGLDSFPYGGATTTLDAAWMGVPVVTLSGPRTLQRAGVCIAANLGLEELVASTEDEFVDKAVTLAGDLAHLNELRQGLRTRLETSPLTDTRRFVTHLEAAYRAGWRRYCEKSLP